MVERLGGVPALRYLKAYRIGTNTRIRVICSSVGFTGGSAAIANTLIVISA
jgi:hypothetical protein